jgi:hypothetical protein
MAENRIKKSDISEDDVFSAIGKSAVDNLVKLDAFDKQLIEITDHLKVIYKGAKVDSLDGINKIIAVGSELNDLTKESIKLDKAKIVNNEAVKKSQQALTIELAKEQEAVKKANAETRQRAKLEIATKGSIEAVRAELALVSTQWSKLTQEQINNTKSGKALSASKLELTERLKVLESATGDNRRNVGNYEGAVKSLKLQLRELTQQMQTMDESDPRFNQMATDAGRLKDKIQDTSAVIKATAGSGVENLSKGLSNVGKVGISAFQGLEGAQALFGGQSEAVMQTLVKLQALAAMSDALEGLGGLGDKMTEIKASFTAAASQLGIFTTAKKVDTVVTEGQTVATEVSTVATNGLGKAMKALPIVLIIAGIAALAYGLYSLFNSNEKVEQAVKKRNEAEKKANEESKLARETIAKESTAFVGLIIQLKKTNENSKERKDLISKINSQYSTTLQNLSDETAFQAQLNLAVADYIEFQKKKYQMAKNEKFITLNLQKQDELTSKIKKEQRDQFAFRTQAEQKYQELIKSNISTDKAMEVSGLKRMDETLKGLNDELLLAKSRLDGYGYSQLVLTEQTDGKYIPVEKELNKEKEKEVKINEELKKSLEDLIEVEFQRTHNMEENLLHIKEQKDEELRLQWSLSTDLINRDKQLKDALILNQIEFDRAMKNLKEGEDVVKAQTEVNKIQFKLNKASGLEAIALEFELLSAKHKLLDEELEAELLLAGNNETEKLKLRSEYALKHQELDKEFKDRTIQDDKDKNNKELEAKRKHQEEVKEMLKKTGNEILAGFEERSKKREAIIDKELDASIKQEDALRQLAASGNITAKDSLAEQENITKEKTLQKEAEVKKQQRIEEAKIIYQSISDYMDKGDSLPKATIKGIAGTFGIRKLISALPAFFKGTKDTGNGGGLDGKGGFLSILHPKERVVPETLNSKLGGAENDEVVNGYLKFKDMNNHQPIVKVKDKTGNSYDILALKALQKIEKAIESQPLQNIELGAITAKSMEIVHTIKKGGQTTNNTFRIS